MTKRQAFFLSLAVGLAVLLPAYFAAAAVSLARGLPAGQAQSGVPILQPTADDRKTLLVMTGETSPQTFVLVRFDALENRVACVETPADTVVLCAGQPDTLADASASAGPAQAAAALRETLKINVDNYLFCTPAQLAEWAQDLGDGRMKLSGYISEEAQRELRLQIPGVQTLTLTPDMLAAALADAQGGAGAKHLLRAQGYLAFLRAGEDRLSQAVPDALRAAIPNCATDLTAAQVYEYARILAFLQKSEPAFDACVLPGTQAGERYELGDAALAAARTYLASAAGEVPGSEDADSFTLPEQAAAAQSAAGADGSSAQSSAGGEEGRAQSGAEADGGDMQNDAA